MADIKITFDEVLSKAKEIHSCNEKLNEALLAIKTNITNLDAQWTSDTSDTIRGKISGMQSKFETYYEIIESYVSFLNETVSTYQGTESQLNSHATSDFE